MLYFQSMMIIVFLIFISCIKCITTTSHTDSCVPVIYEECFSNLDNVISIQLANRNIKSLDTYAFKNLELLQSIDLSFNNITTLSTGLFYNLKYLTTIDFQFNNIIYIEKKCFVNLTSLVSINLRNNNLKTLHFNIIDNVHALKGLYLDHNPWNCDPNLCEFMHIFVSTFWQENFAPMCHSPNTTRGFAWNEVIQLSIPAIVADIQRIPIRDFKKTKIYFQCHTCTQTNLSWIHDDGNVTAKINQTSNKYYTVSSFVQEDNFEGDYNCTIANCPNCIHSSVNIFPKPASVTTRIISWTVVIVVILFSAIYMIFFYKKSKKCKGIQYRVM